MTDYYHTPISAAHTARFWSWFSSRVNELADAVAAVNGRALGEPSSNKAQDGRAQTRRQKLLEELGEQLGRIDMDLAYELSPHATKKFTFTISASGIITAISAVNDLVAAAPKMPEVEVIAFRQPRPLTPNGFSIEVRTRNGERIEIGPGSQSVLSILKPEVTRLSTSLFFKDYAKAPESTWAEAGFYLLDYALGEYNVMAGVGEVNFLGFQKLPDGAFPIHHLADKFRDVAASVRDFYSQLRQQPAPTAVQRLFDHPIIASGLNQLHEPYNFLEEDESLPITLIFFCDAAKQVEFLEETYEGEEIQVCDALSLVGTGWSVLIETQLSRRYDDIRSHITQAITTALDAGAVLESIGLTTISHRESAIQPEQLC